MLESLLNHNAQEPDSKDEIYFEWWLDELKQAGYVKEYYRAATLILNDDVYRHYRVKMKTKEKIECDKIISSLQYTPDYVIVWNDIGKALFYKVDGDLTTIPNEHDKPTIYPMMWAQIIDDEIVSVVDVKPSVNKKFVKFTSSHTFVVKQAMVYERHGIFVEAIKVMDLMKRTFTPTRYTYTDKMKQERKLKWTKNSLKAYVLKLKNEIK